MEEHIKKFSLKNPKLKKVLGVVLIILGLLALVTPLTPGAWLAFIGLELVGVDLIYWTRIKEWLRKKYPKFPL